jgi:hypothetical protein
MNFVSSAGLLSRRIGFEPEEWRMRLRALFTRGNCASPRDVLDAEKIADAWIAEFGDEAAWNAARKIAELLEWDDHDGARVWTEVLNIIRERTGVRKPTD